jgi:hypothetical protein
MPLPVRPGEEDNDDIAAGQPGVDLNAVFNAFHEQLSLAVAENGLGRREEDESGAPLIRGVIYAELIDFNNNGVPELLYIYGDVNFFASAICEIYRYSMGSVELLASYDLYLNHAWINVVDAQSGNSYICHSSGDHDFFFESFYSIIDNQWVEVLNRSFVIDEIYDNDGYWLVDDPEWFINGISVTEQQYYDVFIEYFGNVEMRHLNIFDERYYVVEMLLLYLES